MRRLFLPLLILGTLSLHAQSFIDNAQVNGSFQTDAQYYMLDDGIDITDLNGKKLGINGFGKIGYTYGDFSAGMRFEAFLPEMNGFRKELNGVGLANFFASYDNGFVGVTVGDPNSIIEAMAICGYAIGASKGLVYIRAEYPLAIHRLHPRGDLEGHLWPSALFLGALQRA